MVKCNNMRLLESVTPYGTVRQVAHPIKTALASIHNNIANFIKLILRSRCDSQLTLFSFYFYPLDALDFSPMLFLLTILANSYVLRYDIVI